MKKMITKERLKRFNRNVISGIKIVGIVIFVCILFRVFVGEPCVVPSDSMYPTILTGDRMWIDKVAYGAILPQRWADIPIVNIFTWIKPLRVADEKNDWGDRRFYGLRKPKVKDLAVFKSPEYPHPLLVKRISSILNAGDTILVTPDNYDKMYNVVNNEGHQIFREDGIIFINNQKDSTVLLSQSYYYMLGDNSENSYDSREFGYIPHKSIVGRMNFVFYSIDSEQTGFNKIRWNSFFKTIK